MTQSALISAEELKEWLGKPGIKIIDASYHLMDHGQRIPGAVDFDIDDVAAPNARFSHTLPSPEIFAEKVGKLGISNSDHVIVYDRAGMHMSAARVWWMFRIFGHDNVKVLNGGFPVWSLRGFPVQQGASVPDPVTFNAAYRPDLFKTQSDIMDNMVKNDFVVLDARDPRRYSGEAEPGTGGHIPGSVNTPFMAMIDPATGLVKTPEFLKKTFKHIGFDPAEKPVAISCGSGVTACVVALGLYELGIENAAIYGGSWTEWSHDPSLPKKQGHQP